MNDIFKQVTAGIIIVILTPLTTYFLGWWPIIGRFIRKHLKSNMNSEPKQLQNDPFSEEEALVLAALTKADGDFLDLIDIANGIKKNNIRTQHALDRLDKRGYISKNLADRFTRVVYGLSALGREDVIKRGVDNIFSKASTDEATINEAHSDIVGDVSVPVVGQNSVKLEGNNGPSWLWIIFVLAAIVGITGYSLKDFISPFYNKKSLISQDKLDEGITSKIGIVKQFEKLRQVKGANAVSVNSELARNEENKNNSKAIELIKYCPSENDINLALRTADEAYNNSNRDEMLNKIVDGVLCNSRYELAFLAVSKIYYNETKDSAYAKLIFKAIKDRNFDIANKASDMIYYNETKDKEKQLIVEALNSKH